MAVRVSHKSIVLALLLILFICSPTQGKFIANTYIHTSRVYSYVYQVASRYRLINLNGLFLVEYINKVRVSDDINFCFSAQGVREILRSRTLLVVDKDQETRDSRQDGGGSEGDGLMDMDYNSANKKRPIHNR